MSYFNNVKDLNDLKKQYYALAKKHHPDVGGDTETMNNEYEELFEILKSRHNTAADEQHQTTEAPEGFREIVELLLSLDGLNVELCGSWLWIGGDTKKHKDALKAAGCRWCSKKLLWSWHHAEDGIKWHKGQRTQTMSDIRTKYGSQTFSAAPKYNTIKEAV
jgi:hypothetical protein